MKASKKAVLKQSVILIGVAGGLLFFSACSSTKVLESNSDIPAPSLTPPENANQIVTQELQTQSIISTPEQPAVIQTATSVPGFYEGVEGKVKYTVKKGDSLWRISKMFDVSVRELAAYNNMNVNKRLKVGTILQIPPSGLAAPREVVATPTVKYKKHITKTTTVKKTNVASNSGDSAKDYIVKRGDSLKSIAKKYGITVKELAAANHGITEASKLKAGQKLNIPAKGEKTKKAAAGETKTAPTAETKQSALNDLISNEVLDTSKPADNKTQSVTAAPATTSTTAPAEEIPMTEQKPIATATPNYLPHTVKEGDTWQTISDMYGLTINDLKKANTSVTGEPKVGIIVNIPEE